MKTEENKSDSPIDFVALARSRGVVLNKEQNNYVGACPFHDNSSESCFVIIPKERVFRCEECQLEGDVATFLEHSDGLSRRHAIDLLENGGELVLQHREKKVENSTVRVLPSPISEDATGQELLEETITYYHKHLLTHEQAMDYLSKRKLDTPEILEYFQIGFADRSLGLRLPAKTRKAGKLIRSRLLEEGLLRDTGHAHFNGCVVVPVFHADGALAQMYGKRIDARSPKIQKHLLLENRDVAVFNVQALEQREIILCDTVLNTLSFLCSGQSNACCLAGENLCSQELLDNIIASKVKSVHLAFRSDDTHEEELLQLSETLKSLGVEVYQIRFPWERDANDVLVDRDKDALLQYYRDAVWMGGTNEQSTVKAEALDNTILESVGEYYHVQIGSCDYRVGGLQKNNSMEVMRITLRVAHDDLMHVDSLDLYKDSDRRKYIDRANEEVLLEKTLLKRDLAKLLMLLEKEQERRIYDDAPQQEEQKELSKEENEEAMEFLKDPKVFQRLSTMFDAIGLIGGDTNKWACYLALLSRKLPKPLAIVIQSSSAAGKSALMDGVLSFFPSEEQLNYSAITGQSLFYQESLKNKILAISEEIGFERAEGSIKLLQSQGYLSISTTGKDVATGKMTSVDYHVEGPIALIFTTTSIAINEELMNRCIVLNLEEGEDITSLIHAQQRQSRTLEGLLVKESKNKVQTLMQNAQRLLKSYHVVNPYAPQLTFTARRSRTRRDHEKYLTLIDSIALMRQFQKQIKVATKPDGEEITYIEVELQDIELANSMAPELFGRSLDELAPQTRRLLSSIQTVIADKRAKHPSQEAHFTRREIREYMGWSETQVRNHMKRLEAMEYIIRKSGKQGEIHVYALLTESKNTYDLGLIEDTQTLLKTGTTT